MMRPEQPKKPEPRATLSPKHMRAMLDTLLSIGHSLKAVCERIEADKPIASDFATPAAFDKACKANEEHAKRVGTVGLLVATVGLAVSAKLEGQEKRAEGGG